MCVLCRQFVWINSNSEVILILMYTEPKLKVISDCNKWWWSNLKGAALYKFVLDLVLKFCEEYEWVLRF
jgi:hypothetical protein